MRLCQNSLQLRLRRSISGKALLFRNPLNFNAAMPPIPQTIDSIGVIEQSQAAKPQAD
ncbi:MAG: hypothetical protein IT174_17470 [Acidobacteria bacterium]|nr:hypothetical protein [Acidobacteriota bacterium]